MGDRGTLFVIEIAFDPNQSVFAEDRYANDYQKALQITQTYGGALVVVEGHSDPLGILQAQQKGERKEVLDQMCSRWQRICRWRAPMRCGRRSSSTLKIMGYQH